MNQKPIHVVLLPLVAFVISAMASSSAIADEYFIDATARGWIRQNGVGNGDDFDNNYVIGNCCTEGEYRNWFLFDVSSVVGDILEVEFTIDTGTAAFAQNPTSTIEFSALEDSFGFGDIGTGAVYGARQYSLPDKASTQTISFNAEAFSEIASRPQFTFGARMTEGASFGAYQETQIVFGASNETLVTQLRIVTNSVPEPGSIFLLTSAAGGLLFRRRRRT